MKIIKIDPTEPTQNRNLDRKPIKIIIKKGVKPAVEAFKQILEKLNRIG